MDEPAKLFILHTTVVDNRKKNIDKYKSKNELAIRPEN